LVPGVGQRTAWTLLVVWTDATWKYYNSVIYSKRYLLNWPQWSFTPWQKSLQTSAF
jgi:hypothetical protein